MNAASIAPITAIQFGANRFYEVTAKKITGRDSGQLGAIGIALAAGSTSSIVSGPAELLMIQQQRNARPLLTEARTYISRHGLLGLYRGIVSVLLHICSAIVHAVPLKKLCLKQTKLYCSRVFRAYNPSEKTVP